MEKHAVSKMIGSPPGYVGHEEGGQLTERIRRQPYSVVLFDEIEKAHADLANLLLQILDDGILTDSYGNQVDFRNTLLLMTSNLGSKLVLRGGRMGFGGQNETLAQRKLKVELTPAARQWLLDRAGLDPSTGARPLRRTIQRHVQDSISDLLIRSGSEEVEAFEGDVAGDALEFRVRRRELVS